MTIDANKSGSGLSQGQVELSMAETASPPIVNRARATKSRKSASAFKTISEVAKSLDVQQHVLRFWETKFSQIRPLKRGGGRRYYRPEDVALLHTIRSLLYTEGYTIKGVQKLLRENGKNKVMREQSPVSTEVKQQQSELSKPPTQQPRGELNDDQRQVLKSVLSELKELRTMIKS